MRGIVLNSGKILCDIGIIEVYSKMPFLSHIEFDITESKKSIKNVKYLDNNIFLAQDIEKFSSVSNWAFYIKKLSNDIDDNRIYKVFLNSLYFIKLKDTDYANAYFFYSLVKHLGILPEMDYKKIPVKSITGIMISSIKAYMV